MAEAFLKSIGTAELLPQEYQRGYNAGYTAGRNSMSGEYNRGYNAGYSAGQAAASPSSVAIIPGPITVTAGDLPTKILYDTTFKGPNSGGTMWCGYGGSRSDATSNYEHFPVSTSYGTSLEFGIYWHVIHLTRSGSSYHFWITPDPDAEKQRTMRAILTGVFAFIA